MPYYGYARQDRKVAPRVPISAKLIADLITTAGANRLITLDLHAGQIQGFFDIPVDHLFAAPVTIEYIKANFNDDVVIVSPDAGGAEKGVQAPGRLRRGSASLRRLRPIEDQIRADIGPEKIDCRFDPASSDCRSLQKLCLQERFETTSDIDGCRQPVEIDDLLGVLLLMMMSHTGGGAVQQGVSAHHPGRI